MLELTEWLPNSRSARNCCSRKRMVDAGSGLSMLVPFRLRFPELYATLLARPFQEAGHHIIGLLNGKELMPF